MLVYEYLIYSLSKDTSKRWSTTQLLNHVWITNFNHKDNLQLYNWIQAYKNELNTI